MRLTLRTMLAYLDDILEPDDTEAIGKKIEESEFASGLVHRMRDSMRRLRLGVPAVMGRGLANDPNTVAEYLDNTLATERVPEFERICLESDKHLAEVAACHQVLTLVLGEPAEINPQSRQRMYQLAAQYDAPPVQADAIGQSGGAPLLAGLSQSGTRRAKPQVPDYLRETRSRFWPAFGVVAAAAMLTFALLVLLGPAKLRDRFVAMFDGGAATGELADGAASPAAEPGAEPDPLKQADADTAGTGPAAESVAEATDEPAAAPNGDEPPTAEAPPATATDDDMPPPEPQTPEPQADADDAAAASPPVPTAETPAAAADGEPADGAEPRRTRGDSPADAVEQPASLGRLTAKREVLLRYDPTAKDWFRLVSQAILGKGDLLLSLPSFRPTISLNSNVTIETDGPAVFQLLGLSDQGVPSLAIEFGRLWITATGKSATTLQLQLDGHPVELTLSDGDSSLALDIHRTLPPGQDPEAGPAPMSAELYVTAGMVRVRRGDLPVELPAQSQFSLLGDADEKPSSDEFPKWVSPETVNEMERGAIAKLEPQLKEDAPVSLVLKDATLERRREIRSLAVRCLGYLDSYDSCIEALSDASEKSQWPVYIDELRGAVARGPQSAARVRSTFERQRKLDAAVLFRMLWGYSRDDLKNGADRDLVDALLSEAPDVRLLAITNLQNITGYANFGYHPDYQASKRLAGVKAWNEKLRQGLIVPGAAAGSQKPRSPGKSGKKAAS